MATSFIVPPVVEKFSEDLHNRYKVIRKNPQRIQWPPYQPTSIVNVTVIHYKNKQTRQELLEISEHFKTGAAGISKLMSSPPSHSKVTKDVNEIFKVDPADQTDDIQSEQPKLILIEGAPGIGKTILAKEIAYLWADHKLLLDCKLLILVYLRDPRVHRMKSVEELLQLYATEKETTEVIDYLKKTDGQTVAFVFDGFDEFPVTQESSIIADIIGISNDYGQKFCKSIVVVTSRPTATLFLQTIVDRRIEILGFAPEERDKLISQSVSQFPLKRIELERYFKQHPVISSLCYIPLNLAILLYLFHQGNLPKTLTEMNETFVIHTVYRHLKRILPLTGCIYHLNDMPENIIQILHKLSKLAFEKLQKNQLVFTDSEIKNVCPEVYDIEEAANGFSLLQAVEHHPQKGVGTTTSFNFLHLTMQEYLAAFYVSTLSEELQLELLQNTFWDSHFNFMWIMYVGTVGVKSGVFASFVQNKVTGRKALNPIQQNKMKCLHLFQCYMEANSDREIPQAISSIFGNGTISLTGITLLSHHVTSLLVFISKPVHVQQWKTLELNKCSLQRTEMNNLLQNANKDRMSTLDYVDLSENSSSPWGVYCVLIRYCCVNSLTLCGDEGMNKYIKEITNSLQANATLKSLTLCSIGKVGVKSIEAVLLNTLILKKLNLSWQKSKGLISILTQTVFLSNTDDTMQTNVNILYIGDVSHTRSLSPFANHGSKTVINLSGKNLNNDAAHVLAFGLCNNKKVEELNISNNNIANEGAIAILDSLQHNTKLKKLDLSQNKINIIGMNKMVMNIKKQGTTLSLEYVDLSNNSSSPWGVYCAIIRHCCVNDLTLCGDEGMRESIKEITDSLQANTILESLTLCSIGKIAVESIKGLSMNLKRLNLSWKKVNHKSKGNILINTFFWSRIDEVLHTDNRVTDVGILYDGDVSHSFSFSSFSDTQSGSKTIINLSYKLINDDAAYVLAFGLYNNTTVEELNISNNIITNEGAIAIIDCLKYNKTLKKLDLSQNAIGNSGMKKMLENIENQGTTLSLEYVDLSKNISSSWGVYCAVIRHCNSCVNSLALCGDEGMEEYIKEVTDSLQTNTTLQSLTLYSIGKVGVESVKAVLMKKCTLKTVHLSWQMFNDKDIKSILARTTFLPNTDDIMQTKTTLNDINVVINILYVDSVSLSQSISLFSGTQSYESETETVINLSGKEINDDAAHVLAFGLCNNTTVEELNISDNVITDEGAIAIIDCLKHNKTLKTLDLSRNVISPNGMKIMSENKKTIVSLEYVDLSVNDSSPWGVYCAIIRHCCVNSLTLCGDQGMNEYIKEITDSLQTNAMLESLTLYNIGKVGVESVEAVLMNNSTLKRVNLSWRKINCKDVKNILTHTYFLPNACTGDLMQTETKVVNILYDDLLRRQSISLFSGIQSYESETETIINLSDKEINDDAAHVLAFGLCNNTIVEELNISDNVITDKGVMSIIDCLKRNKTLKKLDLSNNKISINGMNKMLKNIESQGTLSLEYVDLSKNRSSPWDVYCTIIKYCSVSGLTLCGDEGMKEYIKEVAKGLQANTTLQSLTLLDVDIHHLDWLQNVLKFYLLRRKVTSAINEHTIVINSDVVYDECLLTKGSFSNMNIDDDDLIHLIKQCDDAKIEKFNISHNNITDNGAITICDILKHNGTLRELDVSQNKISINGMKMILESIETQLIILSLEYVDLSGNESSSWGVYCAIIKHCCVNSLTLCGDEGMEEYIKEITDSLQANTTLQSLSLCSIGKIGVNSIKTILMNNFTLKRVNLSWKKIYDSKGIIFMHRIFSPNTDDLMQTKTTVDDINRVVDVNILFDDDDVSYIQSPHLSSDIVCTQNYKLKTVISLSIGDDAAHVLAFGLSNNTTVEELNISNNNLTDEGAVAIIDCLKYNKTLKILNISKLYPTMMSTLQKFIKEQGISLSLEYIDLSENHSSPWGVYCAIIKHCCVNSLTLCGDEGMEEYIKEIIDSLQANVTLQSLTLLGVGKVGVESIQEILMNSFTLERLNLSWQRLKNKDVGSILIQSHASFPLSTDDVMHTKTTINDANRVVDVNILYDGHTISHYKSKGVIELSDKSIGHDFKTATHVLAFGLYNNTTIKELIISNSHIYTNITPIINSLKHNKTIKKLDVSCNYMHCDMMGSLIENFNSQGTTLSLEYVDLSRNYGRSGNRDQSSPWGVYCAIIKCCFVNSLTLCGDKGMKEYIKEITDNLQTNAMLESLTLYNIGKVGVESIKAVLMNNYTLKRVNLSWQKIDSKDLENILTRSTFLLNTGDTMQTETKLNDTNNVVNILYDALRYSQSISLLCDSQNYKSETKTVINLSGEGIDDDVVHVLAFGLCNNTTVEELNATSSNIGDEGAMAIMDCLKHNKTLKKLDLSNNKISIDGMNTKMLKNIGSQRTLSLEYVDLSKNQSSPWDVYCTIIRQCNTNSLTLCGDESMNRYINEITNSLQANKTLQCLTLCGIGEIGVKSVEKILMNNFLLKEVNLSWQRFNSNAVENTLIHASFPPRMDNTLQTRKTIDVNVLYDGDISCSYPHYKSKTVINLSDKMINDDSIHVLAFGLHNATIEELNISNSHIHENSKIFVLTIDCLKHTKTLKKLDLSQNFIPWYVMHRLLENFIDQKIALSLEYVDLSENNSSPWGVYCAIIRHCCVNSLTLCGDEGMEEYITDITDNLQVNTTLRSLTLYCIGKIGIESIKAVLLNKVTLKRLNLSWQKFNNEGVENILIHTSFSSSIDDTVETKTKVNILYDEDVSPTFTAIDCIGNHELKNINLPGKNINLSGKSINDDAAHVLAFSLRNNTTVEELDISKNDITEEGAVVIINSLKYNKTLKKLDLSLQNGLFSSTMDRLLESIEDQGITLSLEYVDLSKNIASSPWGVYCVIIRHCSASNLTLCGDEGMKEYIKEVAKSLQANTTLQSLTLHDVDIHHLDFLQNALKIYLSRTKVASAINEHTIVINSDVVYDECLTKGSFSNMNIDDDDLIHLIKQCDNAKIEKFNISHNNTTDNGAITICDILKKHNGTLRELDVSQNKISINGMKMILESIETQLITLSLEYVDLSGNKSSSWGVYCAIIRHCCVNSLTLCGDKGMEEYIKEITDSLQANTTLQSLSLCSIGKIGVNSIKIILMNNFTLKRVNLSWKKIYDSKGIIFMHRIFSPNTDDLMQTKTTVDDINRVVDVNILFDDDDVSYIQSPHLSSDIVCTQNYKLKTVISLSIGDDAAHVLAFGLSNNTTVEELNISNNNLTDEGAVAIIDCLKYNKTLKILNISNLYPTMMSKLQKFIKEQGISLSLEYIDLNENHSSPWGVYCAIIKHCCVNSLTLCGDEEMKEYTKEIIDSLQANVTLQSLTLFGVGKVGVESIQEILMNSFTLKILNLSWQRLKNKDVGSILIHTSFPLSTDDVMHTKTTINDANRVVDVNILYDGHNISHYKSKGVIKLSNESIDHSFKTATHVLAFGLYNNTTIKELIISNSHIHTNITPIINSLKHNKTIKKLDVSCNYMHYDMMGSLIENFNSQGTTLSLEYVDLSRNYGRSGNRDQSSPWDVYCAIIRCCFVNSLTLCGDESMNRYINEITNSLQANKTLQCLTLCGIGEIGVKSVEKILMNNFLLKEVNLSWQRLNSKAVENTLIHASFPPNILQTRKTIDINVLYDGDISCSYPHYKSKTVINLSDKMINDDSIHVLAFGVRNARIEELNISDSHIHENSKIFVLTIDCLKHTKTLKKLDLSQNFMSCYVMHRLLENFMDQEVALSLEYVDLSENNSSPWGVYCAIIRHCCVNSLTLCGDEGMKEYVTNITDSLQVNTTLQSLTLYCIGKIGVESIIAAVFMNKVTLKRLNLSWQKFINKGVENILIHTSFSSSIDDTVDTKTNVTVLYDDDVSHSFLGPTFTAIDCIGNHELKNINLPGKNINLSGKSINNDAAHVLAFSLCNNTTVVELDISKNDITEEGAVVIINSLKHNKTLKKLDLSQNLVSWYVMHGLCILEKFLDPKIALSLEYVDLSENNSSPWRVYCAIIRHCCVNSLTFCGDEGMEEYITDITYSLQVNTTLQSLSLYRIGKIGVESIIAAVFLNKVTLKRLNLSWQKFNNKGVENILIHTSFSSSIDDTVDTKTNINVLYDDDVSHSFLGPTFTAIDCIGNHELKNINLPGKNINLSGKSINDDAAHVLAFSLCNNTTVEELNISKNDITEEGAVVIINSLKHNKTLKKLDLSLQNGLFSSMMDRLLESIEEQGITLSLEYVDLSKNIASSPWRVYCAIIRHCCVNSLTLCGDKGMKEYIKEIIDSLQTNTTLQSVILHDVGEYEAQLLKDSLSSLNTSLINNRCEVTENCEKLRYFSLNTSYSNINRVSVHINVSTVSYNIDGEHLPKINK